MVWLDGGGFTGHSGSGLFAYNGHSLAERGDVVVVPSNHRLNMEGYLNLAEAGGEKYATSGNTGMLDIVLMLEWVRDNISRFGGDPGNGTVFGQSGGGAERSAAAGVAIRGVGEAVLNVAARAAAGKVGGNTRHKVLDTADG
jgi:para-nitrobenzyl esterase